LTDPSLVARDVSLLEGPDLRRRGYRCRPWRVRLQR